MYGNNRKICFQVNFNSGCSNAKIEVESIRQSRLSWRYLNSLSRHPHICMHGTWKIQSELWIRARRRRKKSIEDFDCKLHISLYIRMMIIRRAAQSRTNRPFVPVTRAQEAKGRRIDEMSSWKQSDFTINHERKTFHPISPSTPLLRYMPEVFLAGLSFPQSRNSTEWINKEKIPYEKIIFFL